MQCSALLDDGSICSSAASRVIEHNQLPLCAAHVMRLHAERAKLPYGGLSVVDEGLFIGVHPMTRVAKIS